MAKDNGPKCRICRRAGEKLFLKGERCKTPKCAIVKRNYPPGFHGPKGKKRPTDYGLQLTEKQKAKRTYNLLEKQFQITFERAKKMKGNVGENFVALLETRLDNVVYRLGYARSRPEARQLVGHGFFTVDGETVNIPSYTVRSGQEIAVKANKRETKKPAKAFEEALKHVEAPGWLYLDKKEVKGKVLHAPTLALVNPNFNVQMIVEYYSR